MEKQKENKFRDALVQRIKETGQELIDRAEDMVGPGLDAIAEFHVHIDLSPDTDSFNVPCITWYTRVLNKKSFERMRIELHGQDPPL